jgi:hypothetical protein
MVKVNVKFDQGTPQYACSSCCSCSSEYGKSLCAVQNRGCCWYFPKFTLHEIHKMAKSEEGLKVLNSIMSNPQAEIYHYFIHVKGYFDEEGYINYLESGQSHSDKVADKSIFFRVCSFAKPGEGCTLPEKYRSYICNFYICEEIYRDLEKYNEFRNYIKERNNYVRWIEWENRSLELLLKEKKLSLVKNLQEIIELFKDIPLENYEFPELIPIELENEHSISA